MAPRVRWRRAAEDDLEAAYLFIGSDSPAAGDRFLDAVADAVRLLRDNPALGPSCRFRSPRLSDIRSWVVRGFPSYLLVYRHVQDTVEVVRVLHGARDLPSIIEGQE